MLAQFMEMLAVAWPLLELALRLEVLVVVVQALRR
jgi:hypothetical protein